jgi:cytochrome P450
MVAFTRYGDQSRRQRKLMTRALSVQAVKNYEPLIAAETHAFLRRLIHTPNDYVAHIKRYSGQLTLSTVYGYRVNSNDDAFLTLANECVDLLSQKIASGGGIWPVDVIPACSCFHIPCMKHRILT